MTRDLKSKSLIFFFQESCFERKSLHKILTDRSTCDRSYIPQSILLCCAVCHSFRSLASQNIYNGIYCTLLMVDKWSAASRQMNYRAEKYFQTCCFSPLPSVLQRGTEKTQLNSLFSILWCKTICTTLNLCMNYALTGTCRKLLNIRQMMLSSVEFKIV